MSFLTSDGSQVCTLCFEMSSKFVIWICTSVLFPPPCSVLSRRPGMRLTSTSFRPKSAPRRTTWRRSKPAYWEVSSWRAASASSARRSRPRPSVRPTAGSTGGPLHRGAEGTSEDQRPQTPSPEQPPPCQTSSICQLLRCFCVVLDCLGTSVPSWFLMITFRIDQTRWCASVLLRQYMWWRPASVPKSGPCKSLEPSWLHIQMIIATITIYDICQYYVKL